MSEGLSALEWLLSQEEPEARRVAVAQLAKLGLPNPPVALLVRALSDPDWRVRKEAAQVIPQLEGRCILAAELAPLLSERDNIGLRNALVEALVGLSTEAITPVLDRLASLDADGRKLAAEVLGGIPDLRAMRALALLLEDPDMNVRATAAESLSRAALCGPEAQELGVTALRASLQTGETTVRLAALDSLAALGARIAWTTLEPFFRDPLLRRQTLLLASASGDDAALPALVEALGDPSSTVAREAMLAVHRFADGASQDGLSELRERVLRVPHARVSARECVRHVEDKRLRGAALVVLGLVGSPEDVSLAVEALGDGELIRDATLSLKLFGVHAVAPMVNAERTASPAVRAAILSLLPGLPEGEAGTVSKLLRDALLDMSPEVVASAVKSLGILGAEADLSRIVLLVGHEDARVRTAAIGALGNLAARTGKAARALALSMDVASSETAAACVIWGALAEVSPLSVDEVAFLKGALLHEEARTRRLAVQALALSPDEGTGDAIAFALMDEEREVRMMAARALGSLGRADHLLAVVRTGQDPDLIGVALRALSTADPDRAFRAARPLVRSTDPAVACAAVEAIGELDNPRREEVLFEALEHPESEVVKVALSEIASASSAASTVSRLGLCLDHASWEVRRLAAELLGQSGGDGAKGLLRSRYEREKDPMVREAIASAVTLRPPAAANPPPNPSSDPRE